MAVLRWIIATGVIALGTVVIGWWAVPVVGALYAWMSPPQGQVAWPAALGGAAAWGALLITTTATGQGEPGFAARLGESMGVPGVLLTVATLALPALLAGLSAVCIAFLRQRDRVPGR